jgi:hypothetical protein
VVPLLSMSNIKLGALKRKRQVKQSGNILK